MFKSVIVSIRGGLGNQLFQYAAGASLANRLKYELALDLTHYTGGSQRQCIIDKVLPEEMPRIRTVSPLLRTADALLRKSRVYPRVRFLRPVFCPSELGWAEDFERLGGSVCLSGYFQSHKYFDGVKDHLSEIYEGLRKLRAAGDAAPASHLVPVSVHVRRGDYSEEPAKRARYGLVGQDYYEAAIRVVQQEVSHPLFVVLSDDPDAARRVLPQEIDAWFPPPGDEVEDFVRMASCDHHIIANSTFSWWAAWFGKNPTKRIIVPSPLFPDRPEPCDMIPTEWTRVEHTFSQ